jgi:hypothetical protein
MYNLIPLQPLTQLEVREALSAPAASLNVAYTDAALDAAVQFCDGHPWYVQLLGSEAWSVATDSPIGETDVAAAAERVQGRLEEGFFPSMVRALPRELSDVLVTLAQSDSPDPVRDVAGVLHADEDEITDRVFALVSRDLVEVRYDDGRAADDLCASIAVPRLAQFVSARFPTARPPAGVLRRSDGLMSRNEVEAARQAARRRDDVLRDMTSYEW